LVPALCHALIQRTFAGLRPATPDGLPIIGPVDAIPGFYLATGHEGDGIALSAITGHLIAQCVQGLPPTVPLDNLSLNRFAAHTARPEGQP
jgi:sarcosine oxidase subunit beta